MKIALIDNLLRFVKWNKNFLTTENYNLSKTKDDPENNAVNTEETLSISFFKSKLKI